MSSLWDAMDRYMAEVLRAVSGDFESGRGYDPIHAWDWKPDLDRVEEVVGFEIGDEIRTLWTHPLPGMLGLPFIYGPAGLLLGGPNTRFCHHPRIPVEAQIPLINVHWGHSLILIYANAADQGELWVGGLWADSQATHPFQLTLTEYFDLLAEAASRGIRSPEHGFRVDDLEGDDRMFYAMSPDHVVGRVELAQASGYSFPEGDEDRAAVARGYEVSRERVARWEERFGALPEPHRSVAIDEKASY